MKQNASLITKSIRLNHEQSELLAHVSQVEGVSEAALMQRFVLDSLARHRLEAAIQAYEQGEADLAAAARHAGVSVYHMMSVLSSRNIASPNVSEKFVEGLKSLVETFGGSDALRQTISEFETLKP
jgi:predicted HTH domain antitoxin